MRLLACLALLSLIVSGCDSADSPPETVTGRWEGGASASFDTTFSGTVRGVTYEDAPVRARREETVVFTVVDNEGILTGRMTVGYVEIISLLSSTGLVSYADTSSTEVSGDVEGVYAAPYMETQASALIPSYRQLSFEVAGNEATADHVAGFSRRFNTDPTVRSTIRLNKTN